MKVIPPVSWKRPITSPEFAIDHGSIRAIPGMLLRNVKAEPLRRHTSGHNQWAAPARLVGRTCAARAAKPRKARDGIGVQYRRHRDAQRVVAHQLRMDHQFRQLGLTANQS